MLGTMEGSQNELGRFNEKQWDKFVKDSINKKEKELKAAEEKSKNLS